MAFKTKFLNFCTHQTISMKVFLFAYILLITSGIACSQSIIMDTLYVDFIPDTLVPAPYVIDSVIDSRSGNPGLVSYSQKRKYLLVPVDAELCTRQPLASLISGGFQSGGGGHDTLLLEIRTFIIERYKGHLSSPWVVKADFPLYTISGTDTTLAGTLVYNFKYPALRSNKNKLQVFNELLNDWHIQFKMDMLTTVSAMRNGDFIPENLVKEPLKRSQFLNLTISGTMGLNFWQVDGELYFTRPETGKTRLFLGNILRYQHTPEYDMIGYGRRAEHFTSRISNSFAWEVNTNLLIGLLKWTNTDDITLYQLFQLSLSSSQCITFNRKNQSGMQYKAGLFENFAYVIGMKPVLQAGIYLGTGYKF